MLRSAASTLVASSEHMAVHTHRGIAAVHSAEDEDITDLLEGSRGFTEAVSKATTAPARQPVWVGLAAAVCVASQLLEIILRPAVARGPHPH